MVSISRPCLIFLKALTLVIAKPSALRIAAALAAACVLALPASLSANSGCKALLALTSGSPKALRNVGVTFNRQGTIDVTFDGKAEIFANANECEISSEGEDFELECEWEFEQDGSRATAMFSAYRVKMQKCLLVPWEFNPNAKTYGERDKRQRLSASIEHIDGSYTDIQLDLFQQGSSSPSFRMDLEISR